MSDFKSKIPFEKRKIDCEKIRLKYPERVPIIVERALKCRLPEIDKHKFLVPTDLTVGGFLFVIRKRIKLKPEEAIFLHVNKILAPTSQSILELYNEHKEDCGFLYITYSSENTFG